MNCQLLLCNILQYLLPESVIESIELTKIQSIRQEKVALRRGRQYLREISADGENFGYPQMLGGKIISLIPWSRILDTTELLLAINNDCNNARVAWVPVDYCLHQEQERFMCLYATDPALIGQIVVVNLCSHRKAVHLTVPAHGFVIYEKLND